MSQISNTTVYPNVTPTATDIFIISDPTLAGDTKTCTVADLQEYFGTKTFTYTLTSTEILNSYVYAPKLISCAVGEYIQIIHAAYLLDFNTTAYSGDGNLVLCNNGNPLLDQASIIQLNLNASATTAGVMKQTATEYSPAAGGNFLSVGYSGTANPTLGDSPIKLSILYRIVKF